MKVLLLENISAVAVEQFCAAGYQVESHQAALDERDLVAKIRDGRTSELQAFNPESMKVLA